jgi:hypothetical protein
MSAALFLWQVAAAVAAAPEVRRTIERRPYTAIGVAMAAGWLLARRAPSGLVAAALISGGRAALARHSTARLRSRMG